MKAGTLYCKGIFKTEEKIQKYKKFFLIDLRKITEEFVCNNKIETTVD